MHIIIDGIYVGIVKIIFSQICNKVTALVGVRISFSLRERLRTHKVFKKDQWFYLNYYKFSIKSYVLDVY